MSHRSPADEEALTARPHSEAAVCSYAPLAQRPLVAATEKHLGQSIVYENRPGASGTLAPAQMAKGARPVGYTVGQIPLGVFRAPFLRQTTYNPVADFTYIIRVSGYVFGVVVRSDAPWKTFQELLADAKANPGKINIRRHHD